MRPALPLWFFVVCSAVACKKNDSGTTATPGDVVLEITALHPRDSDVWLAPRAPDPDVTDDTGYPGDPEPIVIGCDRKLGVEVTAENYTLRAPDTCSDTVQCGTLVVEIDPTDTVAAVTARAAAPNLVLDLESLDLAGRLEGYHVIRPGLQLPDGKPFTHPFAFPPADLTVTFASDACTGAGGAGGAGSDPDGAGGDAAAGGSPGTP